jgi:hypothetical protein
MNLGEIVRGIPILVAVLYFSMLAVLLLKRRVNTWTEIFFELSIVCLGIFALTDFLCYNSDDSTLVLFAGRIGMSVLNLAMLSLVFFSVSFRRNPNRRWLTLLPMSAAVLIVTWIPTMSDVVGTYWGWGLVSRMEYKIAFDIYACFYFLAAGVHVFAASRRISLANESLARKTSWLMLSFAFFVGTAVAVALIAGNARPPPFPAYSISLIMPALATMPLIFPETWGRWVKALKSFEGRRYEVMAVNLMREDGTLIGSKSLFSAKSFDFEKLSKTLAVIQSYVKTSFPASSSDSLRAIDHGDTRILIEKGNYAFIALVLKGKENEFLRRQMRDALASFESWSGPEALAGVGADGNKKGAIKALDMFFAKESLF